MDTKNHTDKNSTTSFIQLRSEKFILYFALAFD